MKALVAAYLDYAIWFLRTGSAQFSRSAALLRRSLGGTIEEIHSVAPRGPFAVEASITRNLDVLSNATRPPETHDSQWADEEVRHLLLRGGDEGWSLLSLLVDNAPDNDLLLEFIGAGPFEYWARSEPTADRLQDLAHAVSDSEKFRKVASAAWILPPSVEQVIAAANAARG